MTKILFALTTLVALLAPGLAFSQTALTGLGGSTMMCVDRDGDAYGAGPLVGTELNVGVNTTIAASVAAGSNITVTPASMTNLTPANVGMRLRLVSLDANGIPLSPGGSEVVTLEGVSGSTVTLASVSSAHTAGTGVTIRLTDLGCLGPDADDLDATVHTAAQGISKYGTLTNFIQALYTPARNYSPAALVAGLDSRSGITTASAVALDYAAYHNTHFWCLSPTGSDVPSAAYSVTAEAACAAPYHTWAHIVNSVAAGDMVIMRDGYNDRIDPVPSGTSGNPTVLMSYPGELAVFDPATLGTNAGIWIAGKHDIVVDGARFQNLGELNNGDTSYELTTHNFYNIIVRHVDALASTTAGESGWTDQQSGSNDFIIEDSTFHDNHEHGIYLGGIFIPSYGLVVQRNIFWNNGWDGLHLNGIFIGATIKQNWLFATGIGSFEFQSGIANSTITSNVTWSNVSGNSGQLVMQNYKDNLNCGAGSYPGTNSCHINSATYDSGTGKVTLGFSDVNGAFDFHVGNYVYVYGVTSSLGPVNPYNCGAAGGNVAHPEGCLITDVVGNTIKYAVASDPGTYVSGGRATMGIGDQTGNLFENNTFVSTYAPINVIRVVNGCVTSANGCDTGQVLVGGDLGYNTFRNNILVSTIGTTNPAYAAPVIFYFNSMDPANSVYSRSYYGADYYSTTTFDHNLFYNLSDASTSNHWAYGTSAPTCVGTRNNYGFQIYGENGAALYTGAGCANLTAMATGNLYANPIMASVSASLTLPQQFDFRLLTTSPAFGAASTTSLPPYDALGQSFTSSGAPSMGAFAATVAGTGTPPPPPPSGPTTLTMISGNNQSGVVSTQLPGSFLAQVTDSSGNPVSGVTVTFTVASGGGAVAGGSGSPSTIQIATDASGNAAATLILGSVAGTNTVTASATALTNSPLTFSATATSSAPAPPPSGGISIPSGTWVTASTDGYPAQSVGWEHLIWVPTIHRAVMLGGYKTPSSEFNTGLLAYSFQANRWDILDLFDSVHNEHHPEAAHPVGSFGFNPATGFITYKCCYSGSSVSEDTGYTYAFDPIGQVGRDLQTSPLAPYELTGAGAFDLSTNLLVTWDSNTGQTWTYNSTSNIWTQETTTCTGSGCSGSGPSPGRGNAAMVYDSANNLSYMFGGYTGTIFYGDLFSYNSSTKVWTQLNPTCPCPSPRAFAGFAYDSINNIFLLFGGTNNVGTTAFADTWVYNPTANTWIQLSPAASPALYSGSAVPMLRMTFDPDDNVFILGMAGASANVYSGGPSTGFPTQMWFFRYSGTGPNMGTAPTSFVAPGGSLNAHTGGEQSAGNIWTAGWAHEPAVASDGTSLYVAWTETGTPFSTDNSGNQHIFVRNASTGAFVGGAYNSISIDGGWAEKPSIAFAGPTLWEAHTEAANSGLALSYLVAKQWNGAAWVGGPVGFMTPNCCTAGASQIAAIGTTPYLALIENNRQINPNEKYIYVASYDGSAWSAVGGTKLNRTGTGTVADSPSLTSDGTHPIVAWAESTAAYGAFPPGNISTPTQVYVSQWNGSAWVALGGSLNRLSTDWAFSPSVTYFQGAPAVCWDERTTGGINQLYCSSWNGTSWVPLGSGALNNNAATGWAFAPSVTTDATNLYVGWAEHIAGHPASAFAAKWNGTSWSSVTTAPNQGTGSTQTIKLAMVGSTVDAAFSQMSLGTTGEVFAEQLTGSSGGTLITSAPPTPSNPCDINGDGVVTSVDVTAAIDQAVGIAACSTADLMHTGQCNVVDVQRVINAALGQACVTGP